MSYSESAADKAKRLADTMSAIGLKVEDAASATVKLNNVITALWRQTTMHSTRDCLTDIVAWRLEHGFQLLRDNPRRWRTLPRPLKRELAMLDPDIREPWSRAAALMELRTWFHPDMWSEVVAPHLPWLDRVAIHLTPFPVSRHVAAIAKVTVERWSPMWRNHC